jgi:dTDP-glucose 4,6-dehydratase
MSQKNERIVITGGAGFIGSHLAERFLGQGRSVLAIDNLITGLEANVRRLSKHKQFKWMRHDISKPVKIAGRVDAVLHFASAASPPDYLKYPIETLLVGSRGTQNALDIARVKKAVFLMASTSEVYGDPAVSPQTENYWGNVNPCGPRSVYDEAKRFAEAMTMAYHRHYRLDTKIARIFNTYGPRMRPEDGRVIPNFISQALLGKPLTVYGSGKQTRSYCYVDDLVAGIDKLMRSSIHEPVNLGNPNEMTVLELAKVILSMTGSKSRLVYKDLPVDDPKQRCPDIARAKKDLGWSPRVGLKTGLAGTIDYFRKMLLKKRS